MLAMIEERREKVNLFAMLAFICGIAALISLCTGTAFFFGGMGICFALLSRRPRMETRALIGMTLCTIACAFMSIMLASSFYFLASSGLLAKFEERAKSVDFTNEREVIEFRDEITEDVFAYYQSLMPSVDGDAAGKQQHIADDPVDEQQGEYAI